MIDDERIINEIKTIDDMTNAIRYVINRDGVIHYKYLKEKVLVIKSICDWLLDICDMTESEE